MVVFFFSQLQIRILLGLILASLVWLAAATVINIHTTQARLETWVLLVDPGHGGVDGGTQDPQGNLEKEINLQVALKLQRQLLQSGIKVILTREVDTDLAPFGRPGRHRRDLERRIAIARAHDSLYLISIHCDWSKDSRKKGASVFYNYHSAESKAVAETIQSQLNQELGGSRKAAPGKYLIIRQRGVTGVLVEIGALSHPDDASSLQNPVYQERVALAIARGILQECQSLLTPVSKEKTPLEAGP